MLTEVDEGLQTVGSSGEARVDVGIGLEQVLDRIEAGGDLDASRNSSVGKALAVIEAFVCGPPSLGVTEVAQRAGIAKSTAFRLLSILADHQIVERREERYVLGKKLFQFGHKVLFCRPRGLRDVALPHLVELYHATGATVQLAMLDGTDVLYIEKLYGYNQVRSPSQVGERLPASVTGLGKALLAFNDPSLAKAVSERLERRTPYSIVIPSHFMDEMERVRKAGYAIDREESSLGLVCIAAPILVGKQAVAAISIASQSSRCDPLVYKDLIRKVAAKIAGETKQGVHSVG